MVSNDKIRLMPVALENVPVCIRVGGHPEVEVGTFSATRDDWTYVLADFLRGVADSLEESASTLESLEPE